MFWQFFDRGERRLQAADQLAGGDPAELPCAGCCQQIQADIGWRGAVRQDGRDVNLQVVGRQIVVLWPHAILKKIPCIAGQLQQVGAIIRL